MQRFPVCSVHVQFQVHRFLLPLFHCSTQGNSCHNTCYEYFFKYLKKEEPNCKCYHSLQELQLSIFEYIEGYYNSKRPHSIYLLQTKQKLSIRSRICKAVPDYFFTFLSTSLTVL
uniref:IS3 family transposase n=1 Tax=Acetatifactor sp. TaxID=1872090 RepID=UPI004025C87D